MAAGDLPGGIPCTGLAAGPAAWAVSTQLNYALVPWACARWMARPVVPALALLLILAALGGGMLSWRAASAAPDGEGGRPHHSVAAIGVLAATLFALTILLQGLAGLLFSGCEW